MKKKTTELVIIRGGRESFMVINDEIKIPLGHYHMLFLPAEGEKYYVNNETNHSLFIVLKRNKVTHIQIVRDKQNPTNTVNFVGRALIFYQLAGESRDESFRMLFVDGRDKKYKNIAMESFGYARTEFVKFMQEIFRSSVFEKNTDNTDLTSEMQYKILDDKAEKEKGEQDSNESKLSH